MSSRKEQKERLREERLARQAAAESAERRRRMLGFGVGGAMAAAAAAAIVVAVLAAGGGDGGKGPKLNPTDPRVPIPKTKTTDLQSAAKTASCSLRSFAPGSDAQEHVNGKVNYKQNPPVFGPHNPVPAHDGDYVGQGAPPTERLVHPLEHSRVIIWYKPALPRRSVQQLETLFAEPLKGQPSGYKQILVQRAGMPFQVAATSWGQQLGCPTFSDKTFDAIRAFRVTYVDKGPEQVPFPE